ncbi:MAG: diadenylate cyclase CdaA [Kiritimatiellia bacterium]
MFPTNLSDIAQILLLTVLAYQLIRLVRMTRAAGVVVGLAFLTVWAMYLSSWLGWDVINYMLRALSVSSGVALLIVFQPEIRRMLMRLASFAAGEHPGRQGERSEETIALALGQMSTLRRGALIAIERQDNLQHYADKGIRVDAPVSAELLSTIFTPPSPLHDGGVIIRNNRILSAHVMFPLATLPDKVARHLGTRHQAAIGLANETDALVLIVSEETGAISIAHDTAFRRNIGEAALLRYLKAVFIPREKRDLTFSIVLGVHGRPTFRQWLKLIFSRSS